MASCGRHTGQFYWGFYEHPSRERLSEEIRCVDYNVFIIKANKTLIPILDCFLTPPTVSADLQISSICSVIFSPAMSCRCQSYCVD